MPPCALIGAKPRLMSSSEMRCEMNGSASMSPVQWRSLQAAKGRPAYPAPSDQQSRDHVKRLATSDDSTDPSQSPAHAGRFGRLMHHVHDSKPCGASSEIEKATRPKGGVAEGSIRARIWAPAPVEVPISSSVEDRGRVLAQASLAAPLGQPHSGRANQPIVDTGLRSPLGSARAARRDPQPDVVLASRRSSPESV
jgi:hypothetical protein